MANQYVNKVAVNGKTVLDLSGDTVYPGMLAKGITAHDKSGAKITGTLTVPGQETRNVELNMQSGNQAIVSSTGMLMKQVTVVKPGTFLPENIKKGVNIGGVIGTLEASPSGGGSSSETWVLNSHGSLGDVFTGIAFVSNGKTFSSIGDSRAGFVNYLAYDSTNVCTADVGQGGISWQDNGWVNEAYRKITFSVPPSGDLLTWLEANAVKQSNDTAVQPEKSVNITTSGKVTITPDAPYDAMASVVANVTQGTETTRVNVKPNGEDMPIGCAWQSVSGWAWTGSFDTTAAFTIPDVLIGGYIVFFRDPMASDGAFNFISRDSTGMEQFDCFGKDTQYDKDDGVMVVRVTAANPTLTFYMSMS